MSKVFNVLALICVSLYPWVLPPVAAGADSLNLTKLATGFQTACLKSNDLCDIIRLNFASNNSVTVHIITLVHLDNEREVVFWNKKWRKKLPPPGKSTDPVNVKVSVFDDKDHKWVPIPANSKCAYCLPHKFASNGNSKRWVQFNATTIRNTRPANYDWSFVRTVRKGEQVRFLVEVVSKNGPTVYASLRSSGFQYIRSTRKQDKFVAMIEGDWVESNRPDYISVSLLPSWQAFGLEYTQAERHATAGIDKLPVFSGTTRQIVASAVRYVKSLHLKYQHQAGTFPSRNISEILASGSADCKGFTNILHALLSRSGVTSQPVVFNIRGIPPLSFSVPSKWPNHVMLYVPALRTYIDLAVSITSKGKYTWQTSADPSKGDIALNASTGQFVVVE